MLQDLLKKTFLDLLDLDLLEKDLRRKSHGARSRAFWRQRVVILAAMFCLVIAGLIGCETSGAAAQDANGPATGRQKTKSSKDAAFSPEKTVQRLIIIHTSDNESDLLGHTAEKDDDVSWGGIARASAVIRALKKADDAPMVVLAAGDTLMPAPALKIEIDQKNAVALSNNILGYDASALGNHEFDLGETFLADFIRQSNFPYLSATLEINGGPLDEIDIEDEDLTPDNTWLKHHPGRILPRGKLCAGGDLAQDVSGHWACSGLTVGLVGCTTETLRTISNISDAIGVARGLDGVKRAIQKHVDALQAEGVDHIVLASHLQDVNKELELIDLGLTGVDVIISGGGDNRLADKGDRLLGDAEPDDICKQETASCYPIVRRARDGNPVLIVATDGQIRYIGHLAVSFDAQGVLTGFEMSNSRPWPVDDASLVELRAEPARDAVSFENRLRDTLAPLLHPFAHADIFLNGTREGVRNRETNLANLSTDAMLWAARKAAGGTNVAFALRNGGGIRAAIGGVDRQTHALKGGPLRPLDVQSAFRFDNPIVLVETTHRVVRETIESGLRGAGTSRGHFPQISGNAFMRYSAEAPEQTHVIKDGHVIGLGCSGARLLDFKFKMPGGDEVVVVKDGVTLDPKQKIKIATLYYLAHGGDAYFPASASNLKPVEAIVSEVKMTEQKSFKEFILALEKEGTWNGGRGYPDPPRDDESKHLRIRRSRDAWTASASLPAACR